MEYSPTSIIVVSVVLPVIALVAICLRFWVRLRVQPTYVGIDDWLILGAFIFMVGDAANLIIRKSPFQPTYAFLYIIT